MHRTLSKSLVAGALLMLSTQFATAMSCQTNMRILMMLTIAKEYCPKNFSNEAEKAGTKAANEIVANEACKRSYENDDWKQEFTAFFKDLTNGLETANDFRFKRCPILLTNIIRYAEDTDGTFKLDLQNIISSEQQRGNLQSPDIVVKSGVSFMPTTDTFDSRGKPTMSMKQVEKQRNINQQIGKFLKIERDIVVGYDKSAYAKGGKFALYLVDDTSSQSTIKCYIDAEQTKQFTNKGFARRPISVVGLITEYTDYGLILNPCRYTELEK